MILAYAVILLTILALILGRDLCALKKIAYNGKPVIVIAVLFALQAGLVIFAPGQAGWQMLLLIATQCGLVFLLLLNRHVLGAKLFALGVILNIIVMASNGGWMPVTPEGYEFIHPDRTAEVYVKPPSSKNIILPRDKTRLWLLSDIIPVSLPWRSWMISVGDIILVLAVGQYLFQMSSIRQAQDRFRGRRPRNP